MSSISSSGNSRQNDKVRKTIEEYENREAEATKKKKGELKRQEKAHADQMQSVVTAYEDQLDSLRENTERVLGKKDLENNQKIEKMRQAYTDSMRSKLDEASVEKKVQHQNLTSEMKKLKEVTDSQRENLENQSEKEIQKRDERFVQLAEESKQKSKVAAEEIMRKSNRVRENEAATLNSGYQKALESKNKMLDEIRRSYNQLLSAAEGQNSTDNEQWSRKYLDAMENKSQEIAENFEMKDKLLAAERESIRDRFDSQLNDRTKKMEQANEEFKESVNERVNTQVRSKDYQIQRFASRLNNEQAKNERLRGIERKNIANAYEKRLQLLDQQREDAVATMKEYNEKRIGKVLDESSAQVKDLEREGKLKMSAVTTKNRAEREGLISEQQDRIAHLENMSEGRVQKILDMTNQNQEKLGRYLNESIETVKANYLDKMAGFNEKVATDQVTLNKLIKERFRNLEANFNSKISQTEKSYEDKISKIKEEHEKEIKVLERSMAQRGADREKAVKLEKDTLAIGYEAKMSQMTQAHEEKLEKTNKRHEDEIQNLAVKMKSISRKV
jgi:hypothetical protein